ncbi:hypothetical protein HJC23_002164 [Cyclotella cryptica]|uniref:Uncharacterized protein n=1 Tax=Cyclotella cryptica TaxID=29204 RepID=A0ABD3Q612_9STRA
MTIPRVDLDDRWNDTDYDTEITQPSSTTPSSELQQNKMLIYDSYEENPCASNDSGNDYLEPCTYTEPQTKFLSCIADDENELLFSYGASATTFEYDYEIHTPSDTDVSLVEAVDEFQNGLAGSIAADFGVYCDHSGRILGKEFYMNTTDDAIGGGGEYAPVCLGVSSSPSDVPDDFITKCIVDVDLSVPTICTPMKGYLTLYARERRRLTSTLESIQNYIESRTSSYLSENILAVSYIGERTSVGVGIINPSLLSRPSGNRMLAMEMDDMIAAGYGSVAIAGFVGGLLYLIKTRRQTRIVAKSSEQS